jgi:hypothetical protein
MHALLFEVGVIRTIGRTVKLDDVFGEGVQRWRSLMKSVGAGIGLKVIGLITRHHA